MNRFWVFFLNLSYHRFVGVSIHASSHDSCSAGLTQTSEETRNTRQRKRQAGESNATRQLLLAVQHLQASPAAGTSHRDVFPLNSELPSYVGSALGTKIQHFHNIFECLHQKMPKLLVKYLRVLLDQPLTDRSRAAFSLCITQWISVTSLEKLSSDWTWSDLERWCEHLKGEKIKRKKASTWAKKNWIRVVHPEAAGLLSWIWHRKIDQISRKTEERFIKGPEMFSLLTHH